MTLYDELDYPGHAVRETHPDHLGGIAILHGIQPPRPDACRVLELGCGDGTNLIPMAYAMPSARFVGIDLAATQVTRGRDTIRALGLPNIELHAMDLLDFHAEDGSFDYIIAHGVYSWVPEHVREHLLESTGRMLARNGIAFISHLAFPGTHLRNILRDAMRQHDDPTRTPAERVKQAREIARWIGSAATGSDAYRSFAASLASELDDVADGALFHDYLADHNEAVHIGEFDARAGRHNLRYLCDAEFPSTRWEHDPSLRPLRAIIEAAGSRSVLEREQLMDLLRCRRFRQTLLCHADVKVQPAASAHLRNAALSSNLERVGADPGRARPERGRAAADVHDTATFRSPGGASLEIDHPAAKAALQFLGERWPEAVSWHSLIEEVERRPGSRGEDVVSAVLFACVTAGFVDVHAALPPLVARAGERPRASALARHEIRHRNTVTTLRHANLRIEDSAGVRLLGLLDGSRTRAELVQAMAHEQGTAAGGDVAQHLERALDGLAWAGLLEA